MEREKKIILNRGWTTKNGERITKPRNRNRKGGIQREKNEIGKIIKGL